MELLKTLAEYQQLIPLVEKVISYFCYFCMYVTLHNTMYLFVWMLPATQMMTDIGQCETSLKKNNK